MTTIATTARATAAALLLAGAAALPASAQTPAGGGGWSAFLGCWRPLSPDASQGARWSPVPNAGAPTLCVVPTDRESAAELVTLAGDSIAARDTVDVAATPRTREREGCSGSESAAWSSDGTRIYMRASYSCARGLAQSSSGVLALSTGEELLDVEQTTRGAAKGVHVSRYVRVANAAKLPRELATRLTGSEMEHGLARGAASAPLTVAAIADLSRQVDPEVVEALLVEHGDHFTVDAKQLAALADAGVPGRITDVMVALTYPRRFAIASAPPAPENRVTANDRVPRTIIDPSLIGYSSIYAPLGYGMYGYSPYAYSPYRYAPYGYGGYGYGGYAYGYYQPPIIVVRTEPARPHGRVVNGQGYARGSDGGTSTGETAHPRPSSGSGSGSSGASSGSSNSGGSSSGSSSSGSSGGTRTAKPRP